MGNIIKSDQMTRDLELKILDIYAEGYGYNSVSLKLGISSSIVAAVIRRHGIQRGRSEGIRLRASKEIKKSPHQGGIKQWT